MQLINTIFSAKTVAATIDALQTQQTGLSAVAAEERLATYGPNTLPRRSKESLWRIALRQFKNPLVYVLIAAAIISALLGHFIDVYVIVVVIILNGAIGFFHEYRVENEIAALEKLLVPHAQVLRDGTIEDVPAHTLVPGDIIILEEGDKIPADGRIIAARNLSCVESSLTGESASVNKHTDPIDGDPPIGDKKNMVWMGTFVASGTARAVITATGGRTIFGTIARSLSDIKKERGHFAENAHTLTKQMGGYAIITAILIFLAGFTLRSLGFADIFLFAIASLVSIIPEGLPTVLTIILAIGARRMAKRKAIIKSLAATETLSVVDTIITDKTGTLTQNTMMVETIALADDTTVRVSGTGWHPDGTFTINETEIAPHEHPTLMQLLRMSMICNNAHITTQETADGQLEYTIINEPTEAALLVLGEKAGLTQDEILTQETIIDAPPFHQEHKFRTTLVEREDAKTGALKRYVYVIGAPESVRARSTRMAHTDGATVTTMTDKHGAMIDTQLAHMTDRALRTLAVGYVEVASDTDEVSVDELTDLVFVGTVGMRDPLRADVPEAVSDAQAAGIRVLMATGDHPRTALAIAKEINLVSEDTDIDAVFTDADLQDLSADDLLTCVQNHAVFARVAPHTKLRIAKVLQENGHVIAMTGDGINDAPALKRADVGIAMGNIGTDVAREASNIILADDNFATIVHAIEEGRLIFQNVRKASTFLVSTNFAEGATIITTITVGLPLPLLPTQILWLNIVTDSFAGVPLAAEPAHTNLLAQQPRAANESILSKRAIPFMVLMVLTMTVATILTFQYFLAHSSIEHARTMAFSVMAFTQLFNVINLRSFTKSLFTIKLLSNKWILYGIGAALIAQFAAIYIPGLQNVLHFVPLSAGDVFIAAIISSSVLVFGEGYKVVQAFVSKPRQAIVVSQSES